MNSVSGLLAVRVHSIFCDDQNCFSGQKWELTLIWLQYKIINGYSKVQRRGGD